MLDPPVRRVLDAPLRHAARTLDRRWVSPDRLSVLGLVLGLASAVTAGLALWWVALVLWLVSRVADGLDGPLARLREERAPRTPAGLGASGAGGFLDITADFAVYGATVVGVAVGAAHHEGAPWWPFLLVLLAYYVNGTAFLAFSSVAASTGRTGRSRQDGRSLSFLGGLAEGTETIVVHSLWLVLPGIAWQIALVWAVVVGITAVQRMAGGYRDLA